MASQEFVISPMNVSVDGLYDALNAQLVEHTSWNSLRVAATGQSLMRFMAIVGGYGQTGVARSQQEQWFDTMRIPTSVVRACRTLGVHVQRRRPGSVTVALTRNNPEVSLTIPAYTPMSVGGAQYFSRVDLRFLQGVTDLPSAAILWQGTAASVDVVSNGSGFQRFVVGNRGFGASNDDVWFRDALGQTWRSTRRGLWRFGSGDAIFQETTLPDGRVELWFGDGSYGKLLPPGTCTVGWIEVDPVDPTSPPTPVGTSVTCKGFPTVTGSTTTVPSANESEKGADFYKIMGPKMRAADESVVTRNDYRAYAMQYPGIVDAQFRGEADVAPGDVRWMNVLAATLLTTRPWTESDWTTFKAYMDDGGIATTEIVRFDPVEQPMDVSLNVFAFNRADLVTLRTSVEGVVRYLFSQQAGSLGALYHPSDLVLAILQNSIDEAGPLVDYVDVLAPETGIDLPKTCYATVRSLTVNVAYTTRGPDSGDIGRRLGV